MFRRPSGLLVPESAAPRGPRVRRPDGDCQLPRLAGGAGGSWTQSVTQPQLTSTVNRPVNQEASFQTGNLLTVDAPSMLSEWWLTAINMTIRSRIKTLAGAVPGGTTLSVIVQLLVGGDIVWQGGAEGGVIPSPATEVGFVVLRVTGDFNTPIKLPHGRTLAARFVASTNIETAQLALFFNENFLPSEAQTAQWSFTYQVRELTGHRTL